MNHLYYIYAKITGVPYMSQLPTTKSQYLTQKQTNKQKKKSLV